MEYNSYVYEWKRMWRKTNNIQRQWFYTPVQDAVVMCTVLEAYNHITGLVGNICKNVGSICPYSILTMWTIFWSGGHICLMMHVKYLYIDPIWIIGGSDFICGRYMCIHPLHWHIKYLAYMPNLVGLFVSCTYLAITCEVGVAGGCILAYMWKIIKSLSTCCLLTMLLFFGIWQWYLFSHIYLICVQCFVLNIWCHYFICGIYMCIHSP